MDPRLHIVLLLAITFSFSSCLAQSGRKGLRDKVVNNAPSIYSNHSGRIDPSRVVQVSWRPRVIIFSFAGTNPSSRVFLYKGFLSDEECDRLISSAVSSDDKSSGKNDDSGNTVSTKLLTSSGTLLNTTDAIVTRIDNRIAQWTFLPKDYSMPLQIMQYGGEEAKQKYVFGNKSVMLSSEPLMATVVLYLSDSASGGEMVFPESEVKSKIWSDCTKKSNILRPVKGNAILFFSVHLNASPDKSSSHARCPVVDGELWVATKFFYLRAITGKKQAVDSDGDDCIDEDESCPQWAAVGECQRNSVFMIGSPDYYGTCRKSCNAC